jgi:hypothetical protein
VREVLIPLPTIGARQMEVWQQARAQRMGVAQSLREKGFRISFYREFMVFRSQAFIGVENIVSPNHVPHQFHTMGQALGYLQGSRFDRTYNCSQG